MSTRIQLKRSDVPGAIPLPSDLLSAELAYNTYDGILYGKREQPGVSTDVVINIAAGSSIPNYLYVTPSGNNDFKGDKLGEAKATVGAALTIATSGTVIRVTPGTYQENNPLQIPTGVSLIGDSGREVIINPLNDSPVFYLSDSCSISNFSFQGSESKYPIFTLSGVTTFTKPPKISNCFNYIDKSIGLKLDGSNISGNYKAVFVDGFEHHGKQGIGLSITNGAYCQAKSIYTLCNDISAYVGFGGVCNLINSTSVFGNYGLFSEGVSSVNYVGIISGNYSENSNTFTIASLPSTPYTGQVIYFNSLYYTVDKINIINGGSGYSRRPTVLINSPSTSWGISVSAIANINQNGSVTSIDIISNGRGYTGIPTVTISPPDVGINTAIVSASISPTYYNIDNVSTLVSGISTITLSESIPFEVLNSSNVYFLKQSRLFASNQTFDYVGTGTDTSTAFPFLGGVSIQENEVVEKNGGLVIYTSTDQYGNTNLGNGVVINQINETMTGNVYTRSIFSNVTPLILALGGE